MATGQKHADVTPTASEPRSIWPVSLLGCLNGPPSTNQLPWPWLIFRACLCPASVLGANETLFQGEEPADVCCLQPYSLCGPACRGMNAQLCGLGNEGLKLCINTCILQAACSCMCLGLPYVAWLAALQRQRVVAKHSVAVTDDDTLATACYPCSLLQMHALLQQHQQQHQHCPQRSMQQQQQQPVGASLRPPKVQHMMTGCASEVSSCPGPAGGAAAAASSSHAGPLTSAMTTSKVLRTVRDHNNGTRSEGAAQGGSQRQGLGGGARMCVGDCGDGLGDSGASSPVSETGVVNSPMLDRRQQQQQQQQRQSASGAVGLTLNSNGTYLRPPPPAVAQQQQQQVGPLTSARSHSSSGGGPAVLSSSQQHPQLPLRPGVGSSSSRHTRTASLGSEPRPGSAAAADGTAEVVRTPDLGRSSGHKRKLPGRAAPAAAAAMASQSCHLPRGFHNSSSSQLHNLQESSTPGAEDMPAAHARASTPAAAGARSDSSTGGDGGCAVTPPRQLAAAGFGAGSLFVHSSCKASLGGGAGGSSCARQLVGFSQEDVPLSAFKPHPASSSSRRGSVVGASSAGVAGAAASMQQQDGLQESNTGQPQPDQQQRDATAAAASSRSAAGAAAGLAALVAAESSRSAAELDNTLQQQPQQYATMQSDMCNYASWLPDSGEPSSASAGGALEAQHSWQEHQQQQQQQQQQQEASEGDMCNFGGSAASPPPAGFSPTGALSPATPSSFTAGAANAAIAAAAAAASSTSPADAAAAGAAGPAAGSSSRPGRGAGAAGSKPAGGGGLAAAWAYMSDMCNLGGSFDAAAVASSTMGRSGLAAALLSRLAEASMTASSTQQQLQLQAVSEDADAAAGSSGASSSSKQPQPQPGGSAPAGAAAGSWPDTAPSPPFATLAATAGTTGGASAAASASAAAAGAKIPPLVLSSSAAASADLQGEQQGQEADDDDDAASSSPPRRKRRGATGGAIPTDSSSRGSSWQSASAGAGAGGSSSGGSRAQGLQQQRGIAAAGVGGGSSSSSVGAAGSAVDGLDPQLLAAVTGTTSRDMLTASQEELAAKLAKLAFAHPAAARQLAGGGAKQQQQQQPRQQQHRTPRRSSSNAGARQQQLEPFYPTMMSDMCNLADPEEEEAEQQQQQQLLSRDNISGSSNNNGSSVLAGRTAAGMAGGSAGASILQQQQPWRGVDDGAGGRAASRQPPPAAAAPGPLHSRPNLPGRPVRQQQQPSQQPSQQQPFSTAASRLGRPSMAGALPACPGGSSNAAAVTAAAAGGGSDTAGPLRAALLLRGLRGPAAATTNKPMPPVGAAGVAPSGLLAGQQHNHSQHQQHLGEESLTSFDSYYVDCDLRHPAEPTMPAASPVEAAADMIANNPLFTSTLTGANSPRGKLQGEGGDCDDDDGARQPDNNSRSSSPMPQACR